MEQSLPPNVSSGELVQTTAPHEDLVPEEDEQNPASGALNDLCALCRAIDFDQEYYSDQWSGAFVADLLHIRASSQCKMCTFLRQMRSRDWEEWHEDILWAVSASLFGEASAGATYVFYVSPMRSPWLSENTSKYFAARKTLETSHIPLIEPRIKLKSLRSLVAICNNYHGKTCGRNREIAPPRLRVIDCFIRQLVVLPSRDTPYVTLSYLWGAQTSDPDDDASNKKLLQVPSTIEDAILITVRLGYRYLWVDRYCIPQQHSPEKNDLINRMGSIYASSTLTIVAACGTGSDSGIAGVSTHRSVQTCLQVNDHQLQEIVLPKDDIGASRWSTRGWTYQEALLAHRRLIFTERQVYFQCCETFTFESYQEAFRVAGSRGRQFLQVYPRRDAVTSDYELGERIQVYRCRWLSYDTDALPAFLGLLNKVSNDGEMFVHLHGLPLCYLSCTNNRPDAGEEVLPYVIYSLLWRSCAWSRRRVGCPSWSWVGWQSTASSGNLLESDPWFNIKDPEPSVSALVDVEIVGMSNDKTSNTFSALDSYGALRSFLAKVQPPHELILTGWCFNIRASWQGDHRAGLRYDASSTPDTGVQLKSLFLSIERYDLGQREISSAADQLLGMIMRYGQHHGHTRPKDYACLLLEQIDDQHYERVGMATFDFKASEYFTEDFKQALHPGIEKRTLRVV